MSSLPGKFLNSLSFMDTRSLTFFILTCSLHVVVLQSVYLDLKMDFTLLMSLFIHKKRKFALYKDHFAEVIAGDFFPKFFYKFVPLESDVDVDT